MYAGVRKIFAVYWGAYGGFGALVRSPYLHASAVLLLLTTPFWIAPQWWDQPISVLPNLLGFTLGGFAIFISFGNDRFKKELTREEKGGTNSIGAFVSLCATFVHFILVQLLALLFAILAKAWWFTADMPSWLAEAMPWLNAIAWAVGYGLFLYALMSVVAATMHVLRIARMFEIVQRLHESDTSDCD